MKIEKLELLVSKLHDKTEFVMHIRNLKQELNYRLAFKKFIDLLDLIKMLGSSDILI